MAEDFRLADVSDFAAVQSLFKQAISKMQAEQIDQWDEIYPDQAILAADIERRQMYLLVIDGVIAAAVVLNEYQDEEYATGNWAFLDGRIAVIHRLCVHTGFQDAGVGKRTIQLAEALLASQGYAAIRLDSFLENPKALQLYRRLGYRPAGIVRFRKGEFQLFEKMLYN